MLMVSDHIDELVKAKLYLEEPARFVPVNKETVIWRSNGSIQLLVLSEDGWLCDCSYGMESALPCGHVRALEQLIRGKPSLVCSTQTTSLYLIDELGFARHSDWDQVQTSSIPNNGLGR